MNIKKGFIMRTVAGKSVAMATGDAAKDFDKMIKLNKTAVDIWNAVSEGKTFDEIVNVITAKYNVSEEDARRDNKIFIDRMIELGIFEKD